jgi:hypothetical protein
MASDYGLNFGFRRSNESARSVAEGRFKTPASGTALLLGTAVQIDSANAGRLKACAANAGLVSGFSGLLVQEEIMFRSFYEQDIVDSFLLGVAKKDRLSVITSGPGTKIWLKNTASQTRADGRSISAVNIWVTTDVAVGRYLGWNGTAWADTTVAAEQWMVVTALDASNGYCEAVLKA